MSEIREATIKGMRDLADFLEANPEAKLPWAAPMTIVWHYAPDAAALSHIVKELGGKWEKGGDDTYFTLDRMFGPLKYHVYAPRSEVCTASVVGQRQVTKREAVDKDAAWKLEAELKTLPTHEVTVTEDIVEWKCPAVLR